MGTVQLRAPSSTAVARPRAPPARVEGGGHAVAGGAGGTVQACPEQHRGTARLARGTKSILLITSTTFPPHEHAQRPNNYVCRLERVPGL